MKNGEIVSRGGNGNERGEGVERVGVADCGGGGCSVGKTGKYWNVWGLGVRWDIDYIIYINIYIGVVGF